MSEDSHKLRLRPRGDAGDQALTANPVGPTSNPASAGSTSGRDATPSDVASLPTRQHRERAAADNLAGLTPQVATEASPPPSTALLNSDLAGPPPPSIQGAQRAVMMAGIAVLIIFIAGGALAYRLFLGPSETVEPTNTRAASAPPANSPVPFSNPASNQPADVPPGSGVPELPPAAPVEPAAASDSPAQAPNENAGSAFRTWVNNVRISGVRVSANPRILIGKVSFNQGDVVDEKLGIIFVGYDKERYVVRFQDSSGAILERQDRVLVPINAPPMSGSRQSNR